MRERQIPCWNATPDEALNDRHLTWNLRYCDRCLARSAGAPLLEASASRDRSVDGMVPASSARVGASRTAADAGSFDGFLSQPSGEQRFRALPSRGTGPSEGRSAAHHNP